MRYSQLTIANTNSVHIATARRLCCGTTLPGFLRDRCQKPSDRATHQRRRANARPWCGQINSETFARPWQSLTAPVALTKWPGLPCNLCDDRHDEQVSSWWEELRRVGGWGSFAVYAGYAKHPPGGREGEPKKSAVPGLVRVTHTPRASAIIITYHMIGNFLVGHGKGGDSAVGTCFP